MANEWTPHDGGPMPIDGDTWIEAQFLGVADPAKGIRREFGFAWQFVWRHDGADDDIIGYREAPRL